MKYTQNSRIWITLEVPFNKTSTPKQITKHSKFRPNWKRFSYKIFNSIDRNSVTNLTLLKTIGGGGNNL